MTAAERSCLVVLGVLSVPSIAFLGYLLVFSVLWQAVYYLVFPALVAVLIWQNHAALFNLPPLGWWRAVLRYWALALALVVLSEVLAALFNTLGAGLDMATVVLRVGQYVVLNIFTFGGAILVTGLVFCRLNFARVEMLALLVVFALLVEGLLLRLIFGAGERLNTAILLPAAIWVSLMTFLPAVISAGAQPRQELPLLGRYVLVISAMVGATFLLGLGASVLAGIAPGLFPPGVFSP